MDKEQQKREQLDPLIELSGSTLYVYLILLTSNKPLGIREIQRRAGFKSPNSARHHLEKLVEKGYAVKTENGYLAVKPGSSLLSHLIYVKGLFLPRIVFYALFSLLSTVLYILVKHDNIDYTALSILTSITIVLWLETFLWLKRVKPLNKLIHESL